MVAQSSIGQAVSNSETFRDKGHISQKDMQRSWCRVNKIAANKALVRAETTPRSVYAAQVGRWATLTGEHISEMLVGLVLLAGNALA